MNTFEIIQNGDEFGGSTIFSKLVRSECLRNEVQDYLDGGGEIVVFPMGYSLLRNGYDKKSKHILKKYKYSWRNPKDV